MVKANRHREFERERGGGVICLKEVKGEMVQLYYNLKKEKKNYRYRNKAR